MALSADDRRKIAEEVAGLLRKSLTETAAQTAARTIMEAVDRVKPARPLHECTREELDAYAAELWPAAIPLGARKAR